jgi:hypothetical protein
MSKMDKRKLHHGYTRLRALKPSYFLLISLLFLALAVYGLRQNNLKMIELRDAVSKADAQNKDVEKALRELREYVYSHMNTDLSGGQSISPPVQLKNRYETLAKQEQQSIKEHNARVANEAEGICAQRHPAGGLNSARVACVQDYVGLNSRQAGDVPSDLYKFDFASPRWTPDLPGISLFLSGLFFAAFTSLLLVKRWLRAQTR